MKKIISISLCCIILLMVFCSCESEGVKQAKEAYENKEYSKVVELLSKEENLSDSAQDLLTISEANVSYENKDYLEAVKKIASSKDGLQNEQFEEMFNTALTDAIANKSAENVQALLSVDDSKADAVYDAITGACKEKDYNGFVVLDGLVEGLDDGDLKTKLVAFDEEYGELRAKAFLVGTWSWMPEDEEKPNEVEVVPYEENLIGRLTKLGPFLADYHYEKDDVYWKDFHFEDNEHFLCYNLTRLNDEEGTPLGETATGTIDYEKGTIKLKLTEAKNTERTWKKK